MPIGTEMHGLVAEIIGSHQERRVWLGSLRSEVNTQRRGTRADLQAMARTLHSDLGKGFAELRDHAGQLRSDLGKGFAELRENVGALLRELDRAQQAMAGPLHTDLTRGFAELRKNVGDLLRELDRAHQARAGPLRSDLAKGFAELKQNGGALRSDLGKVFAELSENVGALLQEMDQAHQAMAGTLHSDLAQGAGQRKAEVGAWLGEVTASLLGAREEWQALTALGRQSPPPEPAGGELGEEEAIAGAAVGEVTAEFLALSDRVFELLASHPDGIRLTKIEREFGLGRFQAARVARHLMDEGKAQQRGPLYFAA